MARSIGLTPADPGGDGKGNLAAVEGLKLDAFGQDKFRKTLAELQEERDAVKELLGG